MIGAGPSGVAVVAVVDDVAHEVTVVNDAERCRATQATIADRGEMSANFPGIPRAGRRARFRGAGAL
ncbi:MAG: hypothetical protein ABJE95_05200 [Byssovorax sp.]